MGMIPEEMLVRRRTLSEQFLEGRGIEIGALHYPLWVGERASVRYVDRLSVPQLRLHYPELGSHDLVEVDIVDDGEILETVEDGSLDFIIANHMLEHTENPIGTIRNHLSKLRAGGVIYYAVPDKYCGFDALRPLTPFDHLVKDDQEGPQGSRLDHFREWSRFVSKLEDPVERERNVEKLLRINYSIHFHVWDHGAFVDFVEETRRYLGEPFRVEHVEKNMNEIIVILRKEAARAAA